MLAHRTNFYKLQQCVDLTEKTSDDQKYDFNKTELIHIYFIQPP